MACPVMYHHSVRSSGCAPWSRGKRKLRADKDHAAKGALAKAVPAALAAMSVRRVSIEGAESCLDSRSLKAADQPTCSSRVFVPDRISFKHHLTSVHMNHSDVLTGRVGKTFHGDCNG